MNHYAEMMVLQITCQEMISGGVHSSDVNIVEILDARKKGVLLVLRLRRMNKTRGCSFFPHAWELRIIALI
jgi:hypothetical protein